MDKSIPKGCFIVVEGIDGAGKTLLCNYIESFLIEKEFEVARTREPGGSSFAEELRVLTERKYISAYTRQLLMYAAREESINQFILPKLQRGVWVISDRHELSSLAYSDISMSNTVSALHEHVINLITPDLTIYIDVDVDVAKKRVISKDGKNGVFLDFVEGNHIKGRYDYFIDQDPSVYKLDGNQPLYDMKQEINTLLTTAVGDGDNR